MSLAKYRLLYLSAFVLLCVGFNSGTNASIIDTFDAPTGGVSLSDNNGIADTHQFSGPEVIGGQREIWVRDAHSGVFGGSVDALLDDSADTLAFWATASAPEHMVNYGLAIIVGSPFEMNHSQAITDSIEIDVLTNGSSANIGLTLFANGNTFSQSLTGVPVGIIDVPLLSFPGMTAVDAADIDGIRLNSGVSASGPSSGLTLGEIRFVPEPNSCTLVLLGIASFALVRRRR